MNLTIEQQTAIEKISSLKVGALFMKQGTGKSRVAIEIANSTPVEKVIFIVPHNLKNNIQIEINKWGLNKEYIITTYDSISKSDKKYLQLLNSIKDTKNMIIADESSFIKNENSKTFNRVITISKHSEYRMILTGTPLTKDEWDIYNQMYFLSPLILNMTRTEFLNTFFKEIRSKKLGEKEKIWYKFSKVNAEYLQKLISPFIVDCDLIFNNKTTIKEELITGNVDEEYQLIKTKLLEDMKENKSNILSTLRILEKLIFTDEYRLEQISKKIKGQCIVFCNFLKEIDYLASKIDCYTIKGSTKNRIEILEEFKNNNKPLLIMLGIGAYGHNLQFCNKVLFSSLTFDYGKIDQAISRIKRIGQTKDIHYTYFESEYNLYNMIKQNLTKKEDLVKIIKERLDNIEDVKKCI